MKEEHSGSAELLKDITRLTVVDHVITNHEYSIAAAEPSSLYTGDGICSLSAILTELEAAIIKRLT